MGNVVSIDRGKFLGDYISRQKVSTILSDALFVLVALAAISIAVGFFVSCGPVSPWLFIVSVQAAVNIGLVKYIWPSASLAPLVVPRTTPLSRGGRLNRRKLS